MEVSLTEVLLRIIDAGSVTVAAGITIYNLKRGNLRPFPVWRYVSLVLVLATIHRWTIGLLPSAPDLSQSALVWVHHINHSLFAVIGLAFTVLVLTGRRKRIGDE